VLCKGGILNVESVNGKEGVLENGSLWMIGEEGCEMKGILKNRSSSFFIPLLKNIEMKEEEGNY
jgi:hypothetical protein